MSYLTSTHVRSWGCPYPLAVTLVGLDLEAKLESDLTLFGFVAEDVDDDVRTHHLSSLEAYGCLLTDGEVGWDKGTTLHGISFLVWVRLTSHDVVDGQGIEPYPPCTALLH